MRLTAPGLLFATLLAAPALAQGGKPCASTEHRQFDFWVGDWEVTTPDGTTAGKNRIDVVLGDCVLQEHWQGAGGSEGESYNLYRNGRWHQTWVDNQGSLLLLEGGLVDGRMVLAGDRPGQDGGTVRDEISWEPMADGSVKQHWRVSTDGGKTWQDAFVGIYRRPKAGSG